MNITTESELKKLLQQLKQEPTNLDLLNTIAIGYFENPAMVNNNEDRYYFEQAYKTQATVKSTHNLAYFLYFEWEEHKRGMELQKQCINMNPRSFYPYYLYGYMLLHQKNYEEALYYLNRALKLQNKADIMHHIGYCHFFLNNFKEAKHFFSIAAQERSIQDNSLFNLALTAYQCNELAELQFIADQLFEQIAYDAYKEISGYELGLLYFLLEDYQKASSALFKQGITGIDLTEWTALSYALYQVDKPRWRNQIKQSIQERKMWISEIQGKDENWSHDAEEEQQKQLSALQAEVSEQENSLEKGLTKPRIHIGSQLVDVYCGCLLFDCKRHQNLAND